MRPLWHSDIKELEILFTYANTKKRNGKVVGNLDLYTGGGSLMVMPPYAYFCDREIIDPEPY
ncbi:hypothetical protein N7537_010796 [Penicillium hordei]|uniref:Uncharacterized protein n=1 Tax=Penicillium hordei TaxID=40994 RepID=A0AAD6GS49_9EURO|nr:uncharacterized protein N7537_010796 [Penicillium hordei]KAJ5588118.1 hypothetical protein N7537_010796 [Penicillium hordei]